MEGVPGRLNTRTARSGAGGSGSMIYVQIHFCRDKGGAVTDKFNVCEFDK